MSSAPSVGQAKPHLGLPIKPIDVSSDTNSDDEETEEEPGETGDDGAGNVDVTAERYGTSSPLVSEEPLKLFNQATSSFIPVTTFTTINKGNRFEESQFSLHATVEAEDEPDAPSQQLLSEAHKEIFSDISGIDGRVSQYSD
jgi:hypothetical protein